MTELNISENAYKVLHKRYLLKDKQGNIKETPKDLFRRVAKHVADGNKEWEDKFYEIMTSLKFMPNSPTLTGSGRDMCLSACFVMNPEDDINSIFEIQKKAATVFKEGGGVGYDFSDLRPSGSKVKSTQGVSSGPISFMKSYDAMCHTIKQGGVRRGAQMGVLRVDHPDVEEFIACKDKENKILSNFNISLAITDKFMDAVNNDSVFQLTHPKSSIRSEVRAVELLRKIAENSHTTGDPGLLFIDRANRDNPTSHIGEYKATNPCVTKDNIVMTSCGPKTVENLVGKKFFAVINAEEFYSDGFFKTGNKKVYKLNTKEGHSIRLTADHKVSIRTKSKAYKDVPSKDLSKGDKIVLNCSKLKWDGFGNNEEGWLIGSMLGDGHLKKDSVALQYWGENKLDMLKIAKDYIKNLGGLNNYNNRRKGCFVKDRDTCIITSKDLFNFKNELGIDANKNITNEDLLLTTSSDFHIGFLKGLFDADGSVQGNTNKGVSIRLASSKQKYLEISQRMLLSLGINSKIYLNRRNAGHTLLPDGKGGSKFYKTLAQHELIISKDNILKFNELIGFNDNKKNERLLEIISSYNRNVYKDSFTATFESLEYIGKEDVFDCSVQNLNHYSINGLIVHNCGEQFLPNYSSCNLGSINVVKYYDSESNTVNWDELKEDIHTCVKFLDQVVETNKYPLPEIDRVSRGERRIGLGLMGWAQLLFLLGIPYNSKDAINFTKEFMHFFRKESVSASMKLGEELGNFPFWRGSIYENTEDLPKIYGDFVDSKDGPIQMRNATQNTIAPTGTISLIADCSSGMEPIYALVFVKEVMGGTKLYYVDPIFEEVSKKEGFYSKELIEQIYENGGSCQGIDTVPDKYKKLFVTAMDLTPSEHVASLATFQKFIDSSISKTINLPNSASVEDIEEVYVLAYQLGCKGVTVYRDGCKDVQVLYTGGTKDKESTRGRAKIGISESVLKKLIIERKMSVEEAADVFDCSPSTVRRRMREFDIDTLRVKPSKVKRPDILPGTTQKLKTGEGSFLVTTNTDPNSGDLFEITILPSKSSLGELHNCESLGRLVSLARQYGVPIDEIIEQLEGITGPNPTFYNGMSIKSLPDAIGKILYRFSDTEKIEISDGHCESCGGENVEYSSGCVFCRDCGDGKCG